MIFGAWEIDGSKMVNTKIPSNIYINGEIVYKKYEKLPLNFGKQVVQIHSEDLINFYLGEDIYNEQTGEIYMEVGFKIDKNKLNLLNKKKSLFIFDIDDNHFPYILETLTYDRVTTRDRALIAWTNAIKIGGHYGTGNLGKTFATRFFDSRYYDMERVGRQRLNSTLGLNRRRKPCNYR